LDDEKAVGSDPREDEFLAAVLDRFVGPVRTRPTGQPLD
jgi:hypothetical protein